MRFIILPFLVAAEIWVAGATGPDFIRQRHGSSIQVPLATTTPTATMVQYTSEFQREAEEASTQSKTKTKSSTTVTATSSKAAKSKNHGITKAAKIGIGVGVPLGVIAIVGAIAAYILGKRRGRKRRVDDPSGGAGKKIRDPSSEICSSIDSALPLSTSIVGQTPIAELPTVRSNESLEGPPTVERSSWWKSPFGRSESTKKERYELASNDPRSPRSPQELPA
ncbi:hypothetical protein K491DRAFT_781642 [Lophiostoma macrostomum CBS 122681]|uniref:Mid2 domain-containing protein n=1 Tax=Lophiostoma macrostomum CBS 122681 TaxID=1314788 RepID=A0A6A6SVH8_9PLEO|nr:hypothetical protein K491DRAFT_781642 [Lophiostoma macrostomum CBS 122681]